MFFWGFEFDNGTQQTIFKCAPRYYFYLMILTTSPCFTWASTQRILVIRPTYEQIKIGINSKSVLVSWPTYNTKSCLELKLGTVNREQVFIELSIAELYFQLMISTTSLKKDMIFYSTLFQDPIVLQGWPLCLPEQQWLPLFVCVSGSPARTVSPSCLCSVVPAAYVGSQASVWQISLIGGRSGTAQTKIHKKSR